MSNMPSKKTEIPANLEELQQQLKDMERFVARRFDELSMEVNATSQQVDMAEEGITRRFTEVLEVMKAISFNGDGNTPANAGVELGAVVDMTETAANTILDAATLVEELVADHSLDWGDTHTNKGLREIIEGKMNEIIMACEFQDITGQRIRTTLTNLKEIEERLNTALQKMGIVIEVSEPISEANKASSQDEIDQLF